MRAWFKSFLGNVMAGWAVISVLSVPVCKALILMSLSKDVNTSPPPNICG